MIIYEITDGIVTSEYQLNRRKALSTVFHLSVKFPMNQWSMIKKVTDPSLKKTHLILAMLNQEIWWITSETEMIYEQGIRIYDQSRKHNPIEPS